MSWRSHDIGVVFAEAVLLWIMQIIRLYDEVKRSLVIAFAEAVLLWIMQIIHYEHLQKISETEKYF